MKIVRIKLVQCQKKGKGRERKVKGERKRKGERKKKRERKTKYSSIFVVCCKDNCAIRCDSSFLD